MIPLAVCWHTSLGRQDGDHTGQHWVIDGPPIYSVLADCYLKLGLCSISKTLANVSLKHRYFRPTLANVILSWTRPRCSEGGELMGLWPHTLHNTRILLPRLLLKLILYMIIMLLMRVSLKYCTPFCPYSVQQNLIIFCCASVTTGIFLPSKLAIHEKVNVYS